MPRRHLDYDVVRSIALALPETHEHSHMGHPDLRVRNKIFVSLPDDGASISLKAAAEEIEAMAKADPQAYRALWGGRYLGVTLAFVSARVLRALIVESWRLTAPKSLVAAHRAGVETRPRDHRSRGD